MITGVEPAVAGGILLTHFASRQEDVAPNRKSRRLATRSTGSSRRKRVACMQKCAHFATCSVALRVLDHHCSRAVGTLRLRCGSFHSYDRHRTQRCQARAMARLLRLRFDFFVVGAKRNSQSHNACWSTASIEKYRRHCGGASLARGAEASRDSNDPSARRVNTGRGTHSYCCADSWATIMLAWFLEGKTLLAFGLNGLRSSRSRSRGSIESRARISCSTAPCLQAVGAECSARLLASGRRENSTAAEHLGFVCMPDARRLP